MCNRTIGWIIGVGLFIIIAPLLYAFITGPVLIVACEGYSGIFNAHWDCFRISQWFMSR